MGGKEMELDNNPSSNIKNYKFPKDTENGVDNKFNCFKNENATSDRDTLAHLLKASLGTGILAMPSAFRNAGLVLGIISTIVVSFICTYCAYTLAKCAQALYDRTDKRQMSYADVAETSLNLGPKPLRIFAKPLRIFVDVGLFMTYYGACIVYTVIVAASIQPVLDYHRGIVTNSDDKPLLVIGLLLVPFILLTLVPDWKKLARVSMIANIFMFISLAGIASWLIYNMSTGPAKSPDKFRLFGVPESDTVSWYSRYPETFSTIVFALGAIGVVMPLQNKMMTPENFIGPFGVLNQGMSFVTVMYMVLGILGYVHDPASQEKMVMLEIPIHSTSIIESLTGQGVRILVAAAIFCTYSLQFFVCLDISWSWIQGYFAKDAVLPNRLLRIFLVIISVVIALICPHIDTLISLVGAICLSIMGLLVPVVIESVTYWKNESIIQRTFRTFKNVLIGIVAILALYFGTTLALKPANS